MSEETVEQTETPEEQTVETATEEERPPQPAEEEGQEEEGQEEETPEERPKVPLDALHAEREKHKETKRELEYYKELSDRVAQRQAEQFSRKTSASSQLDYEKLEELGIQKEAYEMMTQHQDARDFQRRVNESRFLAKQMYSDYDDVMDSSGIYDELDKNQALEAEISAEPYPAISAYLYAKGKLEGDGGKPEDSPKPPPDPKPAPKEPAHPRGLAGTKGSSPDVGGPMSRDKARDLTSEEWDKLPEEEKQRLLRGD